MIQLVCKHDLKEATLIVSGGSQVIFQGKFKGKKKGGFLGIRGGYTGAFSTSLNIPGGAGELSVRVITADGSVDLSRAVPAFPPAGPSATLLIQVSSDRLALNWQAPGASKPLPNETRVAEPTH